VSSTGSSRPLTGLLVLACSVLLSFVLVEGVVRLTIGEQPKFPRRVVEAPWGLRYNEPGARYRHKSADMTTYFEINGRGMRADRDIPYQKRSGLQRILSLGDSYTIGYEVDADATFSMVLEQVLRRAGYDVEVLNAGVSGFSTAEEYLYLERELFRYDPDVVVLSFVGNDFVDNLRTDLFAVDSGKLSPKNERYIPAGGVGNFLNTNWFFNFLSERSDAFVVVKERATRIVKRHMLESNRDIVRRARAAEDGEPDERTPRDWDSESEVGYGRELTVAILEQLYSYLHQRGIALVIHSIPTEETPTGGRLIDLFPLDEFDVERPGIHFFGSRTVLDPYVGHEQIIWRRSHGHWTPLAHRVVGEELASVIVGRGLIEERDRMARATPAGARTPGSPID